MYLVIHLLFTYLLFSTLSLPPECGFYKGKDFCLVFVVVVCFLLLYL